MQIILKKPIVSEKSLGLAKSGWYTFLVNPNATKPVIARVIEEKFGVNVVSIKTITLKGGSRMQRGGKRKYFTIPASKKAVVKLKDGQKIGIFETEAKQTPEEPKELKVKEKKSLLRGTKVRIEKESNESEESKESKVKKGKK